MGIAGTALGLGLGLASSPRHDAWWHVGALFDADFAGGRYFCGGRSHADESAWLAAIGGTRSGNMRTIGPLVVGAELLADGDFSDGTDGWVMAATHEANGVLSQVDGALRCAYTGASAFARFMKQLTTSARRAYAFGATVRSKLDIGGSFISGANNDGLGGASNAAFDPVSTPLAVRTVYGAVSSTSYFGLIVAGLQAATTRIDIDDASVRECHPYAGFTPNELAAAVDFTTPAAASGNKVLAQWGDNSERSRVRLVWDAATNLRLIVTTDNVEQANLDLGVVAVNSRHEVKFAVASNRVSASLDGGALVSDTSVSVPGIGLFWIGRSFTGEPFDGSIHRVTVWPTALPDAALTDPARSIYVFGDSTAAGSGESGGNAWFNALAAGYAPDRTAVSAGVGGETSTQMLARVQADVLHREWTTIFMDLPNTGEPFDTWLANITAAAALLRSERWYVHPPAQNSPGGTPLNSAAVVSAVQAALLADPYFAGHTLDPAAQATYLGAVDDDATRVGGGDYLHFNSAGQAIQAAAIRSFLDGRGW